MRRRRSVIGTGTHSVSSRHLPPLANATRNQIDRSPVYLSVCSATLEGVPIDEREVIHQAKQGDREAIESLVRLHQDVAFRTAWIITRNTEDARDAAQIAMFKAINALPRFRDGSPFRPWLLRIVANEAKDIVTSASRRTIAPLDEAAFSLKPAPDPSPESLAEQREEAEMLLAAIDRLDVDHRLVIAYRYLLGLSEAEMASALAIPPGTVKSRLSRSLKRLRESLSEDAAIEANEQRDG